MMSKNRKFKLKDFMISYVTADGMPIPLKKDILISDITTEKVGDRYWATYFINYENKKAKRDFSQDNEITDIDIRKEAEKEIIDELELIVNKRGRIAQKRVKILNPIQEEWFIKLDDHGIVHIIEKKSNTEFATLNMNSRTLDKNNWDIGLTIIENRLKQLKDFQKKMGNKRE